MNKPIKQTGEKTFVYLDSECYFSDEKACRLTDTGNGYQVKFYGHSSIEQDVYMSLDYSQADYLFQALKATHEGV